jgi:hypothetical protein
MEVEMQRRKFLLLAGGGVVLAAGAGAAGFLLTRTPESAYRPWSAAGASLYDEPRRRALSYAILAPNPHNRQPWIVDLATPDEVVLHADTGRLLPHTDPFSRQITIGLGCFLELMTMAAAEDGYRVDLALFPEGSDAAALDGRPVARARFVADPAVRPDPLFAHVLERRSLKEPYDLARPVPEASLAALRAAAIHGTAAGTAAEPERVEALRALTREALRIETATPRTYKESVDLFRIGRGEIEANPDGIDFGGPLFDSLALAGMLSREAALDTNGMIYQQGLEVIDINARSAMAHVWLVSDANSRTDQINAGRDWVRVNLAATAEGVGCHPLSQALQEFPEMAEPYGRAHALLAPGGGTVQMLARLGYANPVGPSPRWPLEAKIA